MANIIIMGMVFDSSDVPDFGSIYCSKLLDGATFKGVNEYGLKSADVAKLDLITNAACGSTAFCVDTTDIYVLMNTGWEKVGGTGDGTRSTKSATVEFEKQVSEIGGEEKTLRSTEDEEEQRHE